MKRLIGIVTIMAFVGYVICFVFIYNSFDNDLAVKSAFNQNTGKIAVNKYKAKELTLLGFIESRIIRQDGSIYTSIKKGKPDRETLSESIGLIMEYSVLSGRKELFDREYAYLRDNLLSRGSFIKWKYGEGTASNSLIDDLRIIRALLNAHQKWGEKRYFDSAGFMQEAIYKSQINNGVICELYDWKYDKTKNVIPLCYLDFYSIDKLGVFNTGWVKVRDSALNIADNGLFPNGNPLFYKYYDYQKECYLPDEELKDGKGICLTYTIYTALHLAEMNENTVPFTDWLKSEIKKGRLYAWYNPKTLKPAQKGESTAVYALAAIYADKVGEDKLAKKLSDKMLGFMIRNKKSPYYGGFGDKDTGEIYSFDNLTALLALAVVGEER